MELNKDFNYSELIELLIPFNSAKFDKGAAIQRALYDFHEVKI